MRSLPLRRNLYFHLSHAILRIAPNTHSSHTIRIILSVHIIHLLVLLFLLPRCLVLNLLLLASTIPQRRPVRMISAYLRRRPLLNDTGSILVRRLCLDQILNPLLLIFTTVPIRSTLRIR
jgi:hypothetical protein